MKRIKLTNCDEYTLVDDEDFEKLNKWKWHKNFQGYVVHREHIRVDYKKYRGEWYRMHRLVMGLEKSDKREIDHKNGNKLDNRKSELRISNRAQNGANLGLQANNTSGCRGVVRDKVNKKWRVQFMFKRKGYTFGRYENYDEAVQVAKQKRIELFGEFGATR